VLHGDVATVLLHVAAQFHQHVEPLNAGWCWGYYYRKIAGSKRLSNHASGTAIDLNAPNHPMGRANTFSPGKRAEIRKILHFCEGVVRWGGDYTGRKDDMHFEIVGNAAAVARIAKKIRTGHAAKPAPAKLDTDGVLGPATIKRWQQIMHTPVDGTITDPSDLVKAVQKRLNSKGAKLAVDGRGIHQDGRHSNTIKALQRYLGVPVTGALTPGKSSATVVALQRRLNGGKF
jgi:hypothetical protein